VAKKPLAVTFAFAVTLALASIGAFADDVYLRTGGRLVAQSVRPDRGAFIVDLDGGGRVRVPIGDVERIEHVPTDRVEYGARAARLTTDDLDGWRALGVWARERGLDEAAREAFDHVLVFDPDNATANEGLGRVRFDGRWMTHDEAQHARGYVRFEGRWILPAERDAQVRERAQEERLEREKRARRAAEAKLQEAEARAEEAAARAQEAKAEAEARVAALRAPRLEDPRPSCARGVTLPALYANGPGTYFTVCTVNGQPRLCVPVPVADCTYSYGPGCHR
jgi:hypothetical protein